MNNLKEFKWNTVIKDPPHDQDTWVEIIAHIKNNKTGEIREYKIDEAYDEEIDFINVYLWETGNFSCDCNRGLFFHRSKEEEEIDYPCSKKLFSVNLENPFDKTIIYREFQ